MKLIPPSCTNQLINAALESFSSPLEHLEEDPLGAPCSVSITADEWNTKGPPPDIYDLKWTCKLSTHCNALSTESRARKATSKEQALERDHIACHFLTSRASLYLFIPIYLQ